MQKRATVFSDQSQQPEKTQEPSQNITLSPEQYQKTIKEAYKKGAKDAMTEKNDEHITPAQKGALSESEKQNKEEHWQENLTADQKEGVLEGRKEASKIEAKKREQTRQKLEAIAERHDVVLLRAQTVFPFSLFPDTIIIDTTKLSVIRKQMFATEHITTIPLKDISDATVQTALFLATLTVVYMPRASSPGMVQPVEDHITSLKRADAMRAKDIIKGMLVASSENIDISQLQPEEIVNVIEKFGHSEGVT